MPHDPEDPADLRRLRFAAQRLRHDLGKYVRLSAPPRREESAEALRCRLEADLCRTRSGPSGPASAPELFDLWRAEEGKGFSVSPDLAGRVEAIAAAVEEIRGLLPRLAVLPLEDLVRLDEASLAVAEGCRELTRASVEEEA